MTRVIVIRTGVTVSKRRKRGERKAGDTEHKRYGEGSSKLATPPTPTQSLKLPIGQATESAHRCWEDRPGRYL